MACPPLRTAGERGPQRRGFEVFQQRRRLQPDPGLCVGVDEPHAVAHGAMPQQRRGIVDDGHLQFVCAERVRGSPHHAAPEPIALDRGPLRVDPDTDIDV